MTKKTSRTARTKDKVSQVLSQARESLKLLETLEKETLAKARSIVKVPSKADRKRMTNDKIVTSLRKLGLVTRDEVDVLRARIEKLEAQIAEHSAKPHSARDSWVKGPSADGTIPQG